VGRNALHGEKKEGNMWGGEESWFCGTDQNYLPNARIKQQSLEKEKSSYVGQEKANHSAPKFSWWVLISLGIQFPKAANHGKAISLCLFVCLKSLFR
jgi:hypothetical protein